MSLPPGTILPTSAVSPSDLGPSSPISARALASLPPLGLTEPMSPPSAAPKTMMAAIHPRLPGSAAAPAVNAGGIFEPATLPGLDANELSGLEKEEVEGDMVLELADGLALKGTSFGAKGKSISGECVFQTGMVGYPESLTDPSYSGQILVITFPLVGNYGVPPRPDTATTHIPTSEDAHNVLPSAALLDTLPAEFESSHIHVAALVVANYHPSYSHHLANSTLGRWLKEQGVPAIWGIDTRMLTKRLREGGVLLGRVLAKKTIGNGTEEDRGRDGSLLGNVSRIITGATQTGSRAPSPVPGAWQDAYDLVPFADPNDENLVAKVSTKKALIYAPVAGTAVMHPTENRPLRVLAIDVGMKWNQIRCFRNRGVEIKVVPWDYDVTAESEAYDGLFISNGPGDPSMVTVTIENLRKALVAAKTPIFGICLGHQLLALASGAKTSKMKYGNRGMNLPCTSTTSGRCYITSQNHGYQVNVDTLKEGWSELFKNANDGSNEGIWCPEKPFFSVQFHPESAPGPRDTEFLFDVFIKSMADCASAKKLLPIEMPGGKLADNVAKHPRVHAKKVLVLGSGGLSIGQAGEFDYSGSQAIKALKEEGIYTILINPNIATIQTSKGLADKVYFLPVTPDFVRKVIKHEKPDGIYCTFGGQTALNVGIKLKDEFADLGVKVLGTPIDTIITTEDREMFARAMEEIGEKCAKSATATSVDEAITAAQDIGFPVIVRAAFALGGLGSGFAQNVEQLTELCNKAFATSPQVLVERSMKGWKEIEYEVVRDCRDNCITVCNMENFDPLGIHTGDSIVIAPSQTLSDADYNMLRTTAVNVIRHLGVVGECNIQYALNPFSKEYCIIEVNARLSRSSALASKATGYPLAFIAAKLGLNIPLNEIRNSVTKETSACFEPSLDYVVVKIPRWDLKKFSRVDPILSSSMKSVGEVMAIGRTFEETIQKAIRCIDDQFTGFGQNNYTDDIDSEICNPTDKRLFAIAAALHKGYSVDKLNEMSNIDPWFLTRLERLVKLEQKMSQFTASTISSELIRTAKQQGFSDRQIAKKIGSNELAVRRLRVESGISPFVKQIDTVAAEFPCHTNYLYMTYNASEHDLDFNDHGVMVLGSGVYRIGSSVEFDWCAVRAIRTLREHGQKTVMVNYNPETVSTDYDEADRLYFETISLETVLDIYDIEQSSGVMLAMGGQTPNNIALPLHRQNVKIYGTSPEMIDTAENRYKFSRMLDKIGVDQPLWKELTSFDEAQSFCDRVGFPVLVRPSYVLSGAAMNVVYSSDDLVNYLTQATNVSRDHPVVISKYIEEAKEIEMDAVAKDGKMVMHYVSEHVENAGVHSGDATLILPPQDLDPETVRRIEVATAKIGQALNVTGPYNIQFIAKNNEIKVIECNLRAARSFPFVSKVTGIDAIEMATKVMFGLPYQAYPEVKLPPNYVGVKVPQFSFSRLSGADPVLGVEMASTGEVACFGKDKYEAYLKALISTGITPPKQKNILLSIGSYKEKSEMLPSCQKLQQMGYNLFATSGTADYLQENGVPVKYLEALQESDESNPQKAEYSLTQHLANNLIDVYINLPSKNRFRRPASYVSKGYKSRRMAVDFAIPLITNVKCAKLFIEAIIRKPSLDISSVDYKTSHETHIFPGLINVQAFVPGIASVDSDDVSQLTEASVRAGFTSIHMAAQGASTSIEDSATLQRAQSNASNSAHCDYFFSVAANADNAERLGEDVLSGAKALYVPFNDMSSTINKVTSISKHFASWPAERPIVTDARATDLASILLLASLNGRSIHITNVATSEDLKLISLAKDKGLSVTFDVAVYTLFFTKEQFPAATCLPSKAEQDALWESIDEVDMFSVGSVPYQLAKDLGKPVSAAAGIEETLPLLLSAVVDGRLTLDDITSRLYDNPRAIFDLPEQAQTYVEVEIARKSVFSASEATWSPLANQEVAGAVHRVVLHGSSVFLDGTASSMPIGRDISAGTSGSRRQPRPSMTGPRPSMAMTSPLAPHRELAPSLGSAFQLPREISPARPLANLQPHPAFHRKHILSAKQFTREDLHYLFGVAQEMRLQVERFGGVDTLKGRVIASLFYEPSTRTSASFEAAMKRCGGQVVTIAPERSSVQKGESLSDTVRTLGCYADGIVLRHPEAGSTKNAAKYSPVPIISGGDGVGEHPSQSLLDILTMREELGTLSGINVTMVGDLKNGRTVHSLVTLLGLYNNVRINFVSPPSLKIPESTKREATAAGIEWHESSSWDEFLPTTHVLYMTRVQKERFTDEAEYLATKDAYIVDNHILARMRDDARIIHPLPRTNEISHEVDFDSRAAYFRQMKYGLYVRMALLTLVLA